MKRTLHLAPPLFFKPRKGLLYSNRLPLNSTRERALSDAAKKDSATRSTAQKEMTLLEGLLALAKITCAGKKQHR
ncbi:MAG: hypothetical protein IDH49_01465 [Gammaproteobacteria bacterium]|nr:hypothetical protein [Gammaproteobacteria bacterium]